MNKVWCEHWIQLADGNWNARDWGQGFPSNFCPICGTPRPVEKKCEHLIVEGRCCDCGEQIKKKVELPEKFEFKLDSGLSGVTDTVNLANIGVAFNKLIDYLASKPWESK